MPRCKQMSVCKFHPNGLRLSKEPFTQRTKPRGSGATTGPPSMLRHPADVDSCGVQVTMALVKSMSLTNKLSCERQVVPALVTYSGSVDRLTPPSAWNRRSETGTTSVRKAHGQMEPDHCSDKELGDRPAGECLVVNADVKLRKERGEIGSKARRPVRPFQYLR